MIPKSENITIPIKRCNASDTIPNPFNPSNLTCLHSFVLRIHPEWLIGFNAAFKKSIGNDEKNVADFGVSSTGLTSAQIGLNYSIKNESNSTDRAPTIQFNLNLCEKLSKLSICFWPQPSIRLKFNNQLFAPSIFGNYTNEKRVKSTISWTNALNVDWIGECSRVSISLIARNNQSFACNLSFLVNVSPNFVWSSVLNFNDCGTKYAAISLKPYFAAAFFGKNMIFSGSVNVDSLKVDLSCLKQITDHFRAGSIINVDIPGQRAIGSVFLQYELSDSILRAKIASNGVIGATYEFGLWNLNIVNSAVANINTYKIVYGIKVGIDF